MSKNKKILISALALCGIAAAVFTLNIETHITTGVNGNYRQIKMPLYVKWTQFLARHYEYKRLAREITYRRDTDEKKVLAILDWTRKNIKDVPPGMPACDDHVLNIIIRGYGVPEQFQDVFTTLCLYAGIPAFFEKVYDKKHRNRYILSFVNIGSKWIVFDAYYGVYFRTHEGGMAGVEDIMADKTIIDRKDLDKLTIAGIPYKEYYYNLKPISRPRTLRAEKQMPLARIRFEIMKIRNLVKSP